MWAVVLLPAICMAQDLGRLDLPLLVTIPTAPIPVRADAGFRLVYELHLTNTSSTTVTLNRVQVWGDAMLLSYEGDQLSKSIKPTGITSTNLRTLNPGAHTVVMMWVSVDHVPPTITHRIEGTNGSDPRPLFLNHSQVPVKGRPVSLAPPLRGKRWLAANGPSNDTHHRRSWLSYEGRALVPERFAVDFLRLTATDEMAHGNLANNRSYPGYGAEAIAVADGRVAVVKDGIPDNVPADRAPSGLAADDMGGNLVVLAINEGTYAFYAHLQPGSIRVRTGDRVRTGQTLGLVGNSGNGNAPHLHFQVGDRPSLLLSDGVPFEIDSFVQDGQTRTGEIPLQNAVVDFR